MHARISVTRYVELLFDNSAMLKYMIAYKDLQSTNQIAMLDTKISKYYKVFIVGGGSRGSSLGSNEPPF